LGDLILKILHLRKQSFKSNKTKFKEAKEDEKKYREQIEKENTRKHFEFSDDQKSELKKKFRKASMLCHPDRVSDKFQKAAQDSFVKLKKAYDVNDLRKVSEILKDLKKTGHSYKTKSETVAEKDILEIEIAKLQCKIKNLQVEIDAIKESNAYQTIKKIGDWDTYFNRMKHQLKGEKEDLESQLVQS
jgi:hypothetical protein